jgi:putative serine/threonine protein kinase
MKELKIGKIIGKGKRGVVKAGKYGKKACAIKILNPKSDAVGRIENEGKWLKKLNAYGIGAKYYFSNDKMLIMEFLDGVHLCDFSNDKKKNVLKKIFMQCRVMDKLKVNKYEMHRITKNAIVVKNNPILIDFERCKIVKDPKNITQFCQFMIKKGFVKKSKALIDILKEYKKNMSEKNFKKISKMLF